MKTYKLNQKGLAYLTANGCDHAIISSWTYNVDGKQVMLHGLNVDSGYKTIGSKRDHIMYNQLMERGFLEEVETSKVENILKNYEGV